ncbi:MAG: hypothetical protein C0392_06950 [Syntrophus sp. (in: bacteria)]|nr:hypothetical protein [Syntrophus sp. (in: bacteria)]
MCLFLTCIFVLVLTVLLSREVRADDFILEPPLGTKHESDGGTRPDDPREAPPLKTKHEHPDKMVIRPVDRLTKNDFVSTLDEFKQVPSPLSANKYGESAFPLQQDRSTKKVFVNTLSDELRLVPSLEIKQEYNDNIYLQPRRQSTTEDFVSTASPQIEIAKKTEAVEMSLFARLDQRYYWKNNELNATDQTYRGTLRYVVNPRLSFTGRGDYIQDSRPDRDLFTTGLVLSSLKRHRQIYGLTTDYAFSETTAARLSYDYLKDTYEKTKVVDMESNTVNLGFIHDLAYLANNTKTRVNFGFAHYLFTGTQIDNYTGTVGLVRQLNELWNVTIDVGLRYTNSQFTFQPSYFLPPEQKQSNGLGGTGQIALVYKGEKTNMNFAVVRDVAPAYGQVGATERTMFSFNMDRRFTYELSGIFTASYILNKSDQSEFSANKIDYETLTVSPTLRYTVSKDFFVESSYNYVRYLNNATNQVASRNLFMVRFYLQHRFFE